MAWRPILAAALLLAAPAAAEPAAKPPAALPQPAVDRRTPIEPNEWPWLAIGRINRSGRGFCTGTLIGPRHVLTAAHCLYDFRDRRWAHPDELHFVAGYGRGSYAAHSVAARTIVAPDFHPSTEQAPQRLPDDWAIVVLKEALDIKPIAWRAVPTDDIGSFAGRGKLFRAGYSRERPHLPAVQRDCELAGQLEQGRLVVHTCYATHGDSGSALLLDVAGEVVIVGVHVANRETNGRIDGVAVPALSFDRAARDAMKAR